MASTDAWIGLTLRVSSTLDYEWTDGSSLDYSQWAVSTPSGKQCVMLEPSNGGWHDADCNRDNRVLCSHCNGKLNKFVVVPASVESATATLQCQQQMHTPLAEMRSERDRYELQTLCSLYAHNNTNGCWINDGSVLSMDTMDTDTDVAAAFPLCFIPSELCTSDTRDDGQGSVFSVLNGALFNTAANNSVCDIQMHSSNDESDGAAYVQARNDALILNKQYLNENGIVLIDYLFRMHGDRGGVILRIDSCSAYYIGVSFSHDAYGQVQQKLFVQLVAFNSSDTDYDTMPLAQVNLQSSLNESDWHLLSIRAEQTQMQNAIKLTVDIDDVNCMEYLLWQNTAAATTTSTTTMVLTTVQVGIWSQNASIVAKYLYVSGTAVVLADDQVDKATDSCLPSSSSPQTPITSDVHMHVDMDEEMNAMGLWYGMSMIWTLSTADVADKDLIQSIEQLTYAWISEDSGVPSQCARVSVDYDDASDNRVMRVNDTIFVCTQSQQQELLHILRTNTSHILADIRHQCNISDEQRLNLTLHTFSMLPDPSMISMMRTTTAAARQARQNDTDAIDDEGVDDEDDRYFGEYGQDMGYILLFVVAILATVTLVVISLILWMHCQKHGRGICGKQKRKRVQVNQTNLEMNIVAPHREHSANCTSSVAVTAEPIAMKRELSKSKSKEKSVTLRTHESISHLSTVCTSKPKTSIARTHREHLQLQRTDDNNMERDNHNYYSETSLHSSPSNTSLSLSLSSSIPVVITRRGHAAHTAHASESSALQTGKQVLLAIPSDCGVRGASMASTVLSVMTGLSTLTDGDEYELEYDYENRLLLHADGPHLHHHHTTHVHAAAGYNMSTSCRKPRLHSRHSDYIRHNKTDADVVESTQHLMDSPLQIHRDKFAHRGYTLTTEYTTVTDTTQMDDDQDYDDDDDDDDDDDEDTDTTSQSKSKLDTVEESSTIDTSSTAKLVLQNL